MAVALHGRTKLTAGTIAQRYARVLYTIDSRHGLQLTEISLAVGYPLDEIQERMAGGLAHALFALVKDFDCTDETNTDSAHVNGDAMLSPPQEYFMPQTKIQTRRRYRCKPSNQP